MKFTDMLQHCWDVNQSLLCVGLDPDPKRFPKQFESNKHAILVYKTPHDNSNAEAQQVILALLSRTQNEAFERFGADCVTLSPYMGFDSVEPYLEYPDKGAFILCRTSNKGGDDFQMLDCGGQPLYHAVAKKVEQWNTTGQLGLVIGGTYPKELASVRALTPELNFLVPGIGAQGGDINACVQSGMNAQKTGMVINSSRAILYASSGEDFKEKARAVAMQTRDAINAARGL